MNLVELKTKMTTLRETLEREARDSVTKAIMEFMEKTPDIQLIAWEQYTPYFNDGDVCTFRVCDPAFNFGDKHPKGIDCDYELEIDDKEMRASTLWALEHPDDREVFDKIKPLIGVAKEFNEMIDDSDEILEAAFGDHCRVIVTREGIVTEEYDHD